MFTSMFLRIILLHFLIYYKIPWVNSEDDGPPHDSVKGDYSLEPAGGWPKEKHTKIQLVQQTCKKQELIHPDLETDIPDIIKNHGYDFELHNVTTEDGYILGVFRIKGSPISPPRKGKIPVYLNHGLMGNSLSWLFNYENSSLAFKLANAGYDVFLGNARGCKFSQGHTTLDLKSDAYWDFSFHELGYYDVPGVIDYILKLTGHKDLYYIGHSLGTTQYMVGMSDRPEYGRKIRVGFLLCPAGFVDHLTNVPMKVLFSLILPDHLSWKLALGNFMSQESLIKVLSGTCRASAIDCGACENIAFLMNGYNAKQNNVSTANFFGKRYYDMTSTKVFTHITQSVQFGTFRKYDFLNVLDNLVKYKQEKPPEYDLKAITSPTVIFWGFSDQVTTAIDVKRTVLKFDLNVIKENNRVPIKSFNHLDFLIANDVQTYVYDRIQHIMDKGLYVDQNKFQK